MDPVAMCASTNNQATVALGFDFDAVSIWLHSYDFLESPTKHSRGLYGVDVGVPRILDVLDRIDVPATFFTPGHTIDSFPETCGEIYDRGYAIQHHGWKHTNPSTFESKEDEKADVERAYESIRDLTGDTPDGYRSPYWDFSKHTLDILQEIGFNWDSSVMGNDFQTYYLRENWKASYDEPYKRGEKTDILEMPVSWQRDDWPPFQFILGVDSQGGAPDEKQVFDMWSEQFDWMYEHVDNGLFPLTMHPQVTGQPPRTRYLEDLINYMKEKPNVEFKTFNEVAKARR
jgi:peptidoglycan/xylan/chitin deacetylase (PgdA/CDA1 family)